MEIFKAEPGEIPEVQELVQECIKEMNADGIHQWNDQYPPLDIFSADIAKGDLFKMEEEGRIIGIIVITAEPEEEYKKIEWVDKSGKHLVVHRLAVHPRWLRQEVASKLLDFAEEFARANGYSSIRIDTFSLNPRSIQLFEENLPSNG